MNKLEKLLGSFGWVRKEKATAPTVSSTNPFAQWGSQQKINPQKALDAYSGWVYAAIRAIAMEIGGMEHKLFKIGKNNDTEIFEHELLNLLNAVNDYQTGLELKYVTVAHLESTGNAYWFLEGVNSDTDKPFALHIINPAKVEIVVNREEFPTRIQKYKYRLGNRVYTFEPYQILHFKYPNPSDPFEGVGTVQSIAPWVDADNYAMEFNRKFFQNGARIGGFIETTAAYTPEQLEYIKTSFKQAHSGIQNAYEVLALPKDTTYTEGGKTQKDLDFANLMEMMRDRIIAGFRVPRTALGITDDVNRANAEATDYVFAARTIKPIMQFINSYLNEFLVPRYGDNLYLDFKDPVPEDRITKMEEMTRATGNTPVMSANEAREQYFGLDPVEGGDDVQIPFNFTPLGSPQPKPVEAVRAQKNNRVIKSRFSQNAEKRRSITKTIAEKAASEIANLLKEIGEIKSKGRKDLTELPDEEYEKVYKGFALRVDKYEKKQIAILRHFNDLQRKEVIGNLPKIIKAINKNDLFNRKSWINVFVDLSTPLLIDLAKNEGKEAGALLGINDMDILGPDVRSALDKSIELLSESYNDTTRDYLKSTLETGLKEGLSQAELADLVNGVYEHADEVRALAVARTETFRIANYSTQQAWKQSGIVKSQKWYTAVDERVCPWCSPMSGKVVSIDEDFFKKGDTVEGSDGSKLDVDYSDVGAPPLHVNCRCYLRPENISLE